MISFKPHLQMHGGFLGKALSPLNSMGFSKEDFVLLNQVHGDTIVEIRSMGEVAESRNRSGDALICTVPGIPIAVKTADCVPILISHPNGVIAAVHSGWRGTQTHLLSKVLKKLHEDYQLALSEVQLAIGPAICQNCYEVEKDVAQHFSKEEFPKVLKQKSKQKYLLDLKQANWQLAFQGGIPVENVKVHEVCTRCDATTYFSYRFSQSQGEERVGRNYSWAFLL